MSAHDKFVAGYWLVTFFDSVPYWLPTVLLVVAVAGVRRWRDRDEFQATAADAARTPLPKRVVPPVVDARPGTSQEALATCNAIWYATAREGGQL